MPRPRPLINRRRRPECCARALALGNLDAFDVPGQDVFEIEGSRRRIGRVDAVDEDLRLIRIGPTVKVPSTRKLASHIALALVSIPSPVACIQQAPPTATHRRNRLRCRRVTPTRLPTLETEVGSSVTVIEEEIQHKQERTLPDALKDVPGLNVVQTGEPGGTTSVFGDCANLNLGGPEPSLPPLPRVGSTAANSVNNPLGGRYFIANSGRLTINDRELAAMLLRNRCCAKAKSDPGSLFLPVAEHMIAAFPRAAALQVLPSRPCSQVGGARPIRNATPAIADLWSRASLRCRLRPVGDSPDRA